MHGISYVNAVIYFIKEKALSAHEIHIDLYDLRNGKSHGISLDLPLSSIVFSKILVISAAMKLLRRGENFYVLASGVRLNYSSAMKRRGLF